MRVRLSDEVKAKLRSIHRYIAAESVRNADAMVDRITRRAERIGEFPHAGRRVPEYPVDSLRQVPESPFRIIYRVKIDEVEVITFLRERQLLPDDLV